MITKEDLKRFLDWPTVAQKHILSIYLNIEPSGEAALRRRFEVSFKKLIQSLQKETSPAQRDDLKSDVDRVRQFISGFQPNGQGLVIFADDSEDFIWAKGTKIHLADQAYWLEKPYILPLLEAFDEYERYGIILVDKEKAKVFSYQLGTIEEEKGALAWNDVRRFRTTGKDNMRSAFKLQRTTELHEKWHLEHVAQILKEMSARKSFERLILGGSQEAMDELEKLLPFDLQTKVEGKLFVNFQSSEKELLEHLARLETRIEREKEAKLVEKLVKADRPDNRRVLGLDSVLTHLNRGLVHTLVYSENFKAVGSKCPGCGYLFSHERLMCGRCGFAIDRLPYLLEEMVRRTVQTGGRIEEVREDPARELDKVGGIGAILKENEPR